MKDPAFLFYSSDFLNGVSDLTMEERGQFITLICLQHQKGSLSEKTIRLSVGNVSVDVLSKFCKDDNGNYFNSRLSLEIEKRKLFTESRRNNGSLGGRPKKNNNNLVVNHKDNHMGNHMENVNVNENENVIDNKIKKKEKIEKIEKLKIEIPSKEEFLTYALDFCKSNNISIQKYQIEAKFESWFDAGWKDGNGKKIVNWKTKFKNTAAYMPKSKEISKPQFDYGQSGI